MKKLLKNERGVTLAEVLAVFVIGAILVVILSSIITIMNKQQNVQTTESKGIFDLTYALKVITKDIRQEGSFSEESGAYTIGRHVYKRNADNGNFERDGQTIAKDIVMEQVLDQSGNAQVEIKVISPSGKTAETTITLREED